MTGGPYDLRLSLTDTADEGEDISIVVTVDGTGTLTGTWTLKLWDSAGNAITSGVSCSITSAADREVTGVIAGNDLDVGVYRWGVRRTDAGARVWSAWGTLTVGNLQLV